MKWLKMSFPVCGKINFMTSRAFMCSGALYVDAELDIGILHSPPIFQSSDVLIHNSYLTTVSCPGG